MRHRRYAEPVLYGVAPLLLEADSHHGTGDGTADGPGVADPAAEAAGDPGNDLALYFEFLAHGQQYGLRSNVTLLHDLRGPVLLHGFPFFPFISTLLPEKLQTQIPCHSFDRTAVFKNPFSK